MQRPQVPLQYIRKLVRAFSEPRVQAAGKLLDLAIKAHELRDVVARIAALEEELG